jgi:phage FluMu protein Com
MASNCELTKRVMKSGKKLVEAKCPRCGDLFEAYILYTGPTLQGWLKRFCGHCKAFRKRLA